LENGLVNLINCLPGEEFQHSIVCISYATGFRDRITRPGVRLFELHKKPGKDIGLYGRAWKLLRQLKPDIVHTRNLPSLDLLFPAKVAGVKHLIHGEHGLDMRELEGQNRRYNRLRRLSRLVVSKYVAVSANLANWMKREIGIPSERVTLIYNGVDFDRFHPGPSSGILPAGFAVPGAFIIGTMGRLEAVKDQLTLARAFCRIVELQPALRQKARLVIIGDGALRQGIEHTLCVAGVRELAWLPGFRNNASELYRALDLFVLPSRREGISNTLLEGMATGLPVVGTAVGGTPEILVDNLTGFLVPTGDVDRMAGAILKYVEEPSLAKAHGSAGRERVLRQFSLCSMVESYRQLYHSL
jgi:sugar transferase (PEP-CTERM/EpsH1 system associated)